MDGFIRIRIYSDRYPYSQLILRKDEILSMALNRNDNSVGIRTKTDSYDIRFETYDEASDLIGEIYARL